MYYLGILSLIGSLGLIYPYFRTGNIQLLYATIGILFFGLLIYIFFCHRSVTRNKELMYILEKMEKMYYSELKLVEEEHNSYRESVNKLKKSIIQLLKLSQSLQQKDQETINSLIKIQYSLVNLITDISNLDISRNILHMEKSYKTIGATVDLVQKTLSSILYKDDINIDISKYYNDMKTIVNTLLTVANELNDTKLNDALKLLDSKFFDIYNEVLSLESQIANYKNSIESSVSSSLNNLTKIDSICIDIEKDFNSVRLYLNKKTNEISVELESIVDKIESLININKEIINGIQHIEQHGSKYS